MGKAWAGQWSGSRDTGEDRDASRACKEKPGVVLEGGCSSAILIQELVELISRPSPGRARVKAG